MFSMGRPARATAGKFRMATILTVAIPVLALAEDKTPVVPERKAPAMPASPQLPVLAGTYDQAVKERRTMNHARTELVCRLALLRAQGVKDVTYEDLVMVAGWGTSFAYHPKKYWLIFCFPEDPKLTEERLAKATGWQWEELGRFKNKPDEAWRVLKEALDSGRGVVGAYMDDYVLCGYQDGPNGEDRQVCHLGGWEENGWWTWQQFGKWCGDDGRLRGYTKAVPRADAKEIVLQVMRDAVLFAPGDKRKEVKQFAEGRFGLPGMEAYAADVADAAKDPDTFEGGWLGCFCINRQHYAREAAAKWFRAKAELLAGKAREHLLAAANSYDAACGAWHEFEKHLGRGTGKTKLEELKHLWRDPQARQAGAAAIRKAMEHERAAVEKIGAALAEVEKPG